MCILLNQLIPCTYYYILFYNSLGCSCLELPKYLSSCFHTFNQESVYIQLQDMFQGSDIGQGALSWGYQRVIKTMKTIGMCSCLCVNVRSFVLRLSSSLPEFVCIFPVVSPNGSSFIFLVSQQTFDRTN